MRTVGLKFPAAVSKPAEQKKNKPAEHRKNTPAEQKPQKADDAE